jgi:pilus assembly protein CpaC
MNSKLCYWGIVLAAPLIDALVPHSQAQTLAATTLASNAAIPPQSQAAQTASQATTTTRDLMVTVGKSLIVDSPVQIQRVSVANPIVAEAVAISPRELVINGKAPGETSVIVWQEKGNRLIFDLSVRGTTTHIDAIRRQLNEEFPGQAVTINQEGADVFVRGTVNDTTSADRAIAIASTLGKPVNLLRVNVPGMEAQIVLKVKFADVDRAAISELGANLFSTGALNTIGTVSTQQFSPATVKSESGATTFSVADALNIFLFRPDLDLGATIRAFQSRRLLQILAEPNVLAINGKPASFLAGGEFPFPTLQGGGAGLGSVTIQFREFGVRINFVPVVTPRGSIRLQVTPEVSSLDFANGLVFQGFNIPALSTRRVSTEIELENGQSFVIGGLLDNRLTETISKVPGLGDIPLLGKLFQSRAENRSNTELLVMVTPELVRPIPAGTPLPGLTMPKEFLKSDLKEAPRTPGPDVTGPVTPLQPQETMPVEQMQKLQEKLNTPPPGATTPPAVQFVPVPLLPPVPGAPSPQSQAPAQAHPAQPASAPRVP